MKQGAPCGAPCLSAISLDDSYDSFEVILPPLTSNT